MSEYVTRAEFAEHLNRVAEAREADGQFVELVGAILSHAQELEGRVLGMEMVIGCLAKVAPDRQAILEIVARVEGMASLKLLSQGEANPHYKGLLAAAAALREQLQASP